MSTAKKKTPKVLADHKKVGKKFIPPFVAELGQLGEVRWVNDLVPELLWLALLSERHGRERGVDLARRLALAAIDARGSTPASWFCENKALTFVRAEEIVKGHRQTPTQRAKAMYPLCTAASCVEQYRGSRG